MYMGCIRIFRLVRTPCLHLMAYAMASLFVGNVTAQQQAATGVYEARGGMSTLKIAQGKDGTLLFVMDTTGANGHVCGLDGRLRGLVGLANVGASQAACVIDFKPGKLSLSVSTSTPEACRIFCGVRAWFEGEYFSPPQGCAATERKARRKAFTERYRAGQYQSALETITAFYTQCADFLDWIEIDAVRNDMAVTQWHLGNKAACLAVLKDTRGARQTNEDALGADLPPADLAGYLPVAKATWFNLKQCAKP